MKNKQQGFTYSNSASTELCLEVSADNNPFLTEKRYLAGYDIEELSAQCSFIETLYLLFKQERPSKQQAQVLNALFVALMNAGPRDEAVRGSMAAGVSKTRAEHLLPIGLNILGGENNGAQTVSKAYSFFQQQIDNATVLDNTLNIDLINNDVVKLISKFPDLEPLDTDLMLEFLPGFGQHFGSVDNLTIRLSNTIFDLIPDSVVFKWCRAFNKKLSDYHLGLNPIGLSAAVFLHLDLGARESIGLYQLLRAPGILAHGMEQTHKPITSIPMLKDEDYHFTREDLSNES